MFRAWGAAAATLLLAGCATTAAADGEGGTGRSVVPGSVVVGVYPLQFVAQRLTAGVPGAPPVHNLAAPGVEPHDLELTPGQVASLRSARLVVGLPGLSPALDRVAAELPDDRVLDVGPAAGIEAHAEEQDGDHGPAHADEEGGDHAEEPPDDGHGHGVDVHFWLDPPRLAEVAGTVAERLGTLDPDRASAYRANAARLAGDLQRLDEDLQAGLAGCLSRDLVTAHSAFGHFAERYRLRQRAVSGLTPDDEVPARTLARLADHVSANGVRTVYTETLAPPDLARTLANTTGTRTAVLDPLETDPAVTTAGADYLSAMRANLATLQEGQPCP